ncbi:DUF3043 domain-containing protein [Phytoactinopolyspora halophila]|uniref:DUF3043 domain-containing protein n=1 Tax=Phytoactinopolyspora halophila TaxID=1981511 RepID=UPI001B8D574C|nr:DUF3043 domain-containing protein [Phytoactinopolyspora halophila]
MFRRRSDSKLPEEAPETPTVGGPEQGNRSNGDARDQPPRKGRPTPKRTEAEKARKERVKPPLNKREAMRRERQRVKEQRARARKAMTTGDEKYYLERDRGPERKFLRDYVDSRRTVGEFFLPLIIVILLGNFVPIVQVQLFMMALWLVVMVMLIVDMTVLGIRVKREFRKRFPDDTGRGHTFYALMRAMQIRRLRLPKPAVKPGDLV